MKKQSIRVGCSVCLRDVEEELGAHLSTGVEVFSMKLIIFSFTFTDLDLRANVILLTKDLTPLPSPGLLSDSPCIRKKKIICLNK